MKRDFRPEEIEDWALLYDVHEKIDTAMANGTAGVKKAARKGNRLLNIKRNRPIEFEAVKAVIVDLVGANIITSEERQVLLRRADIDSARTKAMAVADQIVIRQEEVSQYEDNAKRFEGILAAKQPSRPLPDKLKPYLNADRNSVYGNSDLTEEEVAEICQNQLCRRAKVSVRAERGEMSIAKAALDQLQTELAAMVNAEAATYILDAQTRYEVSKMSG